MSDEKITIHLTPFDALHIYAALEEVEIQLGPTRQMVECIARYKMQIHGRLTKDQLNDADAKRAVLELLKEINGEQ